MVKERIKKLQSLMARDGVSAYIILSDDYHASEYVGEYFKVREYMSGFTGSAGTLLVLKDEAYLWTDGRYFIQAADELGGSGITLMKAGQKDTPLLKDFLADKLRDGDTYGFDGRQVSIKYADTLKKALEGKNVNVNPALDYISEIWMDRPEISKERVWELGIEYAGEERELKMRKVRENMASTGVDYFLLSSLDDIAWLYNIRGGDIKYCPMPLSFSLINKESATLYLNIDSVETELKAKLSKDGVYLKPYEDIYNDIKELNEGTLGLDFRTTNMALLAATKGVAVKDMKNPTEYLKAIKNPTEMENERIAHIEDGIALTKLIYNLKNNLYKPQAHAFSEIYVAEKLLELRKESPLFIEQSFAPIIATGEHGAIVHYEPTKETDMPIKDNEFLLMDTGGHYYQGTTDVTRTVAIGEVNDERKRNYTLVLKGNLKLAAATFPKGTTGGSLDYLARESLKDNGLDYNHGTGHGVGYLLNVHEGPQSFRNVEGNDVAFAEGMLTSDEPGLYLEGRYGIRLENLMFCVETEEGKLGFETVTLAPFDRSAVAVSMLSEEEKKTLNSYHKKVYETLAPYLSEEEASWLKAETAEV